jgi:uncharacterized membrane protein YhaH (DUF805 family)
MKQYPNRSQFWYKTLSWLIGISSILSFLDSLLCFWFYYEMYLKWEFNELGRYFDEANSVVYTENGSFGLIPAGGFLLVALIGFWIVLRRRKVNSSLEQNSCDHVAGKM